MSSIRLSRFRLVSAYVIRSAVTFHVTGLEHANFQGPLVALFKERVNSIGQLKSRLLDVTKETLEQRSDYWSIRDTDGDKKLHCLGLAARASQIDVPFDLNDGEWTVDTPDSFVGARLCCKEKGINMALKDLIDSKSLRVYNNDAFDFPSNFVEAASDIGPSASASGSSVSSVSGAQPAKKDIDKLVERLQAKKKKTQ